MNTIDTIKQQRKEYLKQQLNAGIIFFFIILGVVAGGIVFCGIWGLCEVFAEGLTAEGGLWLIAFCGILGSIILPIIAVNEIKEKADKIEIESLTNAAKDFDIRIAGKSKAEIYKSIDEAEKEREILLPEARKYGVKEYQSPTKLKKAIASAIKKKADEERKRNERVVYFGLSTEGLSDKDIDQWLEQKEIELTRLKFIAVDYDLYPDDYNSFKELEDAVSVSKKQKLNELRKEAAALGLSVDNRHSENTLKSLISQKKAEIREQQEKEAAERAAHQKMMEQLKNTAKRYNIQYSDDWIEAQFREAIANARKAETQKLKNEAMELGLTVSDNMTIYTLNKIIQNRKEEIERQKREAEAARQAEERRKQEAERQRKFLFEEASRYGISTYGKSENSIRSEINNEKSRLAEIERQKRAEAERLRKLKEKEDEKRLLQNCVATWYEPSRSNLKCFSMYNYYPTTCGWDVSDYDWDVRKLIWNFKAKPTKPMPLDTIISLHKSSAKAVTNKMCKALRHFFGNEVSKLTLLCIPASTQEVTQRRYEDFSAMVCNELGMSNAYSHVRVAVDGGAKHLGQSGNARYQIDSDFFKDRYILLFDDVITSGGSMETFKRGLERAGAIVVGGFSIGRTRHEPQQSHPILTI